MGQLQTLTLPEQITNAGLEHLKGLTELQDLLIHCTKTTNTGIAKLQKALPNCKIVTK